MCKINGHSIFSYLWQPVWNAPKLFNSKRKAAERNKAAEEEARRKQEEQKALQKSKNQDYIDETAKSAEVNKPNNKDITSLRVPLNTAGTGTNAGNASQIGLNLLGG